MTLRDHARSKPNDESRNGSRVGVLWDEEEAMRLEDFIGKTVVIQPAGEYRPMESGTLMSVEPQGVVILVEGDPDVARRSEYRFYTWTGLTFIAQEATG